MRTARRGHVAVATGYASRVHYSWIGGGYQRPTEEARDRMGDVVFVTASSTGIGRLRCGSTIPKPDLRFFVEASEKRTARGLHHGLELIRSGGT